MQSQLFKPPKFDVPAHRRKAAHSFFLSTESQVPVSSKVQNQARSILARSCSDHLGLDHDNPAVSCTHKIFKGITENRFIKEWVDPGHVFDDICAMGVRRYSRTRKEGALQCHKRCF